MAIDISIIIPVYNEKQTIFEIIRRILRASELNNAILQFIIVDDGSTDGTREMLKENEWTNDPRFIFLFHEKNSGKGMAIRSAIPHAIGEYTIIQDADLEYDPDDIGRMYKRAKEKSYRVLFGSRNLLKENRRGTFLFYWGGRAVSGIGNILFSQKLTDEPTCYKLIETSLLQSFPLRAKKFNFCPEVTAYIARADITIPEIPIAYYPRGIEEGKKINWKDGVSAIATFFHMRFFTSKTLLLAASMAFSAFLVYLATWQAGFGGYEHETATAALALFDGRYEIQRAGIGAVILYLPFIAGMRLFSIDNQVVLTLVPLFYSALTIGFLFLVCKRLYRNTAIAIGSTVLIMLGSSVWPYTNIGMEYQVTLYVTLLLYALLRWKDGDSSLIPAAVCLGIISVTKSYGILFGAGYAVFVYLTLYYRKEIDKLRNYRFLIQLIGIPVVLFAGIVFINYFFGGTVIGKYSIMHEFQIWTWWEGIYGIFFSAGKSIFLYSPLLIITLVYLRPFIKKFPETAGFMFSLFIVLALLTAPFSYWSDETWGVRKLMPVLLLLHVPIGLLWETRKSMVKKMAIAGIICAAVYIQFLGSVYPYGRQLNFLRAQNMDSLQTMRFIPQFGHMQVNHNFFASYIGISDVFRYTEMSWFRWTEPGKADITFHVVDADLTPYETPNVIWVRKITPLKSLIFTCIVLGVISIYIFLFNNYLYCRIRERQ